MGEVEIRSREKDKVPGSHDRLSVHEFVPSRGQSYSNKNIMSTIDKEAEDISERVGKYSGEGGGYR